MFHALCNHPQSQAFGEADDAARDGGIIRVGRDVTHQRLVNFQLVDIETLEVPKVRIAGAKVVNYQAKTIIVELTARATSA